MFVCVCVCKLDKVGGVGDCILNIWIILSVWMCVCEGVCVLFLWSGVIIVLFVRFIDFPCQETSCQKGYTAVNIFRFLVFGVD